MATSVQLIARARKHGIRIPIRALRASRRVGVPFWVTCAFLMQESAGGMNVFGHDPGNFTGAGLVTKDKYLQYKARRKAGAGMQGVGPMQLTYYSFQDRADALGGCWDPYWNLVAGLELVRDLYHANGTWHDAARAYNGSGPAAEAYAKSMDGRFAAWRSYLGL